MWPDGISNAITCHGTLYSSIILVGSLGLSTVHENYMYCFVERSLPCSLGCFVGCFVLCFVGCFMSVLLSVQS